MISSSACSSPAASIAATSARERIWKTESGKAEFTTPERAVGDGGRGCAGPLPADHAAPNDQFNTTIYGYDDRVRAASRARARCLLINPDDIRRAGLANGQVVALVSDAGDGIRRRVEGLTVMPFELPDGRA